MSIQTSRHLATVQGPIIDSPSSVTEQRHRTMVALQRPHLAKKRWLCWWWCPPLYAVSFSWLVSLGWGIAVGPQHQWVVGAAASHSGHATGTGMAVAAPFATRIRIHEGGGWMLHRSFLERIFLIRGGGDETTNGEIFDSDSDDETDEIQDSELDEYIEQLLSSFADSPKGEDVDIADELGSDNRTKVVTEEETTDTEDADFAPSPKEETSTKGKVPRNRAPRKEKKADLSLGNTTKSRDPISNKHKPKRRTKRAAGNASQRFAITSCAVVEPLPSSRRTRKKKKTSTVRRAVQSSDPTETNEEESTTNLANAKQAWRENLKLKQLSEEQDGNEDNQIITRTEWWRALLTGALLLICLIFTTNAMKNENIL